MSRRAQPGRPGTARRTMNPAESNRLFVYEYDRGSNYEEDTRLTAALSALLPEDELVHPDQRLFQTVHLITEYAWCEMHYEMRRAAEGLGGRDYLLAAQLLERAAATGDVAVRALCVLLDFLPQESLLRMRETFPENTTGLDSPGARNLRRAAAALWQETEAALAREGIGMREVVTAQGRAASPAREDRAPDLALVRQALLRLDGAVAAWKHHHLRLVWSQLGGHPETAPANAPAAAPATGPAAGPSVGRDDLPKSLRGQSTAGVRAMAERSLFPRLWDSVDDTYRALVPDEQTPPA
ncbi:hypothetical protein [Streptomyces griseoruber]|uniref:hypothetical protein n=1 Tax=Streptomyces griseoruber TaxID=1943 RepID=UPI0037A066D9